ncbi:MAG: DUF1501 domain-containing protein [Bacteroidota bacterium]
MVIRRKEFLQLGSLATASLFVPKFLKAMEQPGWVPPGNKIVVILQLSGGNDGLNTVIPVRNDIYYRSRPLLGIKKETALSVTDEAALHPALTHFKELFESGELAILNNVGYPNPDRSHFRSMDIWHTASRSDQYWQSGWLGRYLDAQCCGTDALTKAIELDDVLSLSMKGEQMKGMAFKDPRRLYGTANEQFFRSLNTGSMPDHADAPVDYLYKTLAETMSSADHIFKQSRLRPSQHSYPNTELGKSFQTIASLAYSDIQTKVYYLSLGSFDTHVRQQAQQERLFREMNEAVRAFTTDLKKQNRFNDLLLFTFSEFGRRVNQNASGGTDHGTANNMFLIGGGLKRAGLLNSLPDLSDLNEGDLKHQVDFQRVYATVLRNWMGVDDRKILGDDYTPLDFI